MTRVLCIKYILCLVLSFACICPTYADSGKENINIATDISSLYKKYDKDRYDVENNIDFCRYYTVHGKFDSSLFFANNLMKVYRESGDTKAGTYANLYIGQSYLLSSGSDSIKTYLDSALILAETSNDSTALCSIYNALGIYTTGIEMNFYDGIKYFIKAIRISDNGYPISNQIARCNLANAYYMRNDPAGLPYAESVYKIGKETGNEYLAFGGGVLSAYMYHLKGDNETALKYIDESLPQTDKYGYHTELYSLYAKILHSRKEYAEAEKYYKMALEYIDEEQVTPSIITYLNYGTFLIDTGHPGQALYFLDRGIKLSHDKNYSVQRDLLYKKRSEAEEALFNYRKALNDYKIYHLVADSIYNREREYSINELRIKYEAEVNENRLKEQQLTLTKQTQRLQLNTFIVTILTILILSIFFLYKRKDKMYKQIVRQHHDYLNTQKIIVKSSTADNDDKEKERNIELFNRIEELLKTDKLYCSSDISSDKLAKMLNTNRTYISKAINYCSGKNFNAYLNSYRIREAIIKLSDVNNDTPLKAISQELGYNNIQTFYSSFQNEIGMSPSKFREKSIQLYKGKIKK